jgi:hypothetical protein
MRIRLRHLIAVGAVAAIAAAPTAAADNPDQNCTNTGDATECSSPGNVQITSTPAADDYGFTLPYWDEVYGGAYPGPYPVPYAEGSR